LPGEPYAAVVVVNGCANACTSTMNLAIPAYRQINIGSFADLLPARNQIRELLAKEKVIKLDHTQIKEILPHRPPMLFVDRVTRLIPGREATAELFLNPEWDIFLGHFPGKPVFPGVLAVEAMAQTAGLMMMTQELYSGGMPLLAEVARVRFLRRLLPGTSIRLLASVKDERRDIGIVVCQCQVLADDKLCAEATITLAMR